MRLLRVFLVLSVAMLIAVPAFAVTINEYRLDQPSTDNDEYIELAGMPGESLDDIYLVVIGDGSPALSGAVESILDLTGFAIQPDGLFLIAETSWTGILGGTVDLVANINLENSDNVTYMLVSNLNPAIHVGSGFGGSDIDIEDDGIIDPTGDYDGDTVDDGAPWIAIIDCVGIVESVGTGDLIYCTTTVGPDGTFVPGHAYVCSDTGAWAIGIFDPATPGVDTPDLPNPQCNVPVRPTTWGTLKNLY